MNALSKINSPDYPLRVGQADTERLLLTSRIYDPASRSFLARHLPKRGRILEVGCGHGRIAEWIGNSYPDCTITAVDASQDQIEAARRHTHLSNSNVRFMKGNIFKSNDLLADGLFDVALCRFTLLHVSDIDAGIASLLSCVKAGGLVLIEEPNLDSLFCWPPLDEFDDANAAIQKYGESIGVRYDTASQVWSRVNGLRNVVAEVSFAQPTIWEAELKRIVPLSFRQFMAKITEAKILNESRGHEIAASLEREFMRDRYVSGGLRNIQIALRK